MERTCTFSVFGKARTISKSLPNILEVIHKYAEPGTSLKTYSIHKVHGFWENVSRDLGVPNTCLNRKKILKAVLQYEKTTSGVEGPLLQTDFPTAETTLGDDVPSINEEDIVVEPKSPQSVGNVPLPSRKEDALQKLQRAASIPQTHNPSRVTLNLHLQMQMLRGMNQMNQLRSTQTVAVQEKDFSHLVCHSRKLSFINENEWKELRTSLEDLLQKYYVLLTGQHSAQEFNIPILHRCLSHVMKNAKDLWDLGRHGTGPAYQQLSKLYSDIQQSKNQSFRVEMEKWKDKRIKRKGVYVSPLVTELPLKKKKTERLL
ncbi:uncharacterized protein LOC109197877 [Oreochromis niloticus]|uniref:uncharacterized protein LOC109197877 n=1 Tax=Oreochromis niloticus TaxID=8128 RepID=UPI0009056AF5|nr:uncharacterized protein LOC109197877 [Oreochromis niloticus]